MAECTQPFSAQGNFGQYVYNTVQETTLQMGPLLARACTRLREALLSRVALYSSPLGPLARGPLPLSVVILLDRQRGPDSPLSPLAPCPPPLSVVILFDRQGAPDYPLSPLARCPLPRCLSTTLSGSDSGCLMIPFRSKADCQFCGSPTTIGQP